MVRDIQRLVGFTFVATTSGKRLIPGIRSTFEEAGLISEKKPVANSMLVLREEFDDWAILFDPDTGDALGLNPVAVIIWKHLDGSRTRDDIVEVVREKCEDVPDDVTDHVAAFINELVERGYVGYEMERT